MKSFLNCYFFILCFSQYIFNQGASISIFPQVQVQSQGSITAEEFPNSQALNRLNTLNFTPNGAIISADARSSNPSGMIEAGLNPFNINAEIDALNQSENMQGEEVAATTNLDISSNSIVPIASESQLLELQLEQAQAQAQAQAVAQQNAIIARLENNPNIINVQNNPDLVIGADGQLTTQTQILTQQNPPGFANAQANFPQPFNLNLGLPFQTEENAINSGLGLSVGPSQTNSPNGTVSGLTNSSTRVNLNLGDLSASFGLN